MIHSLKFLLTATSGASSFPEFLVVAMVDEVQVGYCDNINTAKPKHEWARDLFKDDPQQLEWYVSECIHEQHYFRASIDNFKQRFNQTEGTLCVELCMNIKRLNCSFFFPP